MINVSSLRTGWNLGNTFDATGGETGWGNPRTTRDMIAFIADAGFDILRIPVTWDENIGAAPAYRVNANWLARVREVAQWGLDAGMCVIINTHHECGWLNPSPDRLSLAEPRFTALWRQIAEYFADMDERLLFEGMNEPRVQGAPDEWLGGDAPTRRGINTLNRAFVEAVRATGGRNAQRGLLITTCGAQITEVGLDSLIVPDDPNLMLSLHAYCPPEYAFAHDPAHNLCRFDADVEAAIERTFDTLRRHALPLGLPIMLTEYGAESKPLPDGARNDADNAQWAKAFLSRARALGIPCVWWDNGYFDRGDEHFALLDRNALKWYLPKTVEAILDSTRA